MCWTVGHSAQQGSRVGTGPRLNPVDFGENAKRTPPESQLASAPSFATVAALKMMARWRGWLVSSSKEDGEWLEIRASAGWSRAVVVVAEESRFTAAE